MGRLVISSPGSAWPVASALVLAMEMGSTMRGVVEDSVFLARQDIEWSGYLSRAKTCDGFSGTGRVHWVRIMTI